MIEAFGDIWEWHEHGDWLAVTTNGDVNRKGQCVMGKGIAEQAAQHYPGLPRLLGDALGSFGNHVFAFPGPRIFSLPVKHHWRDDASFLLIAQSCQELVSAARTLRVDRVALVRPGCGSGGRTWAEVRPIVEPILRNDRFVVVDWQSNARE